MTYETKMLLRLAAPAVVVLGVGLALAAMASTLSALPKAIGGAPLIVGIGDVIALATATLAGVM
jgi:hypothetical protein